MSDFRGTFNYMAPEVAEHRGEYLPGKADMYSLGVILFIMYFGFLPHRPSELASNQEKLMYSLLTSGSEPEFIKYIYNCEYIREASNPQILQTIM